MNKMQEMLVSQLQDAYSAERQAIQLMKRIQRKVTEPQLREGLEAHIAQSEHQRERVEQALEKIGAKAGRKTCEAMRGLVEEAQHEMEEQEKGPLLDLVVVASQQRIEHYEISAYGTMAELSAAMGEEEVASLLQESLSEEKQQDQLLTELTRSSLLPLAISEAGNEAESAEAGEAKSQSRKKS